LTLTDETRSRNPRIITGKLSFQEGALVQAVRKGWWIVLDELNLAPSDVLEALNRLLDDNRELFVPELQETIAPHPHFALFATQNPPGVTYGGRKTLSKAFRNRFMEIHVGDIPDDELRIILNKRCAVAPSYAAKIVEVMRELQRRRRASRAFAGKDGFVTARDLFRWANRNADGYDALAADGFKTLGERLRSDEERDALKETLVTILKAKKEALDPERLYASAEEKSLTARLREATALALETANASERESEKNPKSERVADAARAARRAAQDASALSVAMAWTPAARRLFALVESCLAHKEPALLVGETGCGKTSVCQLLALLRGQRLRVLNCHQHTETGDFLGGFRPARAVRRNARDDSDDPGSDVPFAWEDGPLVRAMRDGDILLVDELSLAEDSVLERLNSVLESGRALTLPEKGGSEVEELVAHPDFRILATMNPGGDFGKKELSPALRNRFCEIWIGASASEAEMAQICARRVPDGPLQAYAKKLAEFWSFYRAAAGRGAARGALLTRDLVAWAQFMRAAAEGEGPGRSEGRGAEGRSAAAGCSRRLSPEEAYAHGAYLTLLDGLGLGLGLPEETAKRIAAECRAFLRAQLPEKVRHRFLFSFVGVFRRSAFFQYFSVSRGSLSPAPNAKATSAMMFRCTW
jgi:midasin